jgi:hypothetical protein
VRAKAKRGAGSCVLDREFIPSGGAMRTLPVLLSVLLFGAAAALADNAGGTVKGSRQRVVPFIEDDYAKALSEARAKKLPIFIEAWAPW